MALLAEKYLKGEHKTQYVPEHDGYMGRLPITDSVLTDRMGINVKEYRDARIRAENRLRIQLKQYADEIEASVRQELPSYVLRMNSLYLKRYEIGMFDQVKEEIVFTQDKSQAKVFTYESEEGRGLAIGFNLTKEEPETSSFYLDVRV
ncbi:hypothetical protein ACQKTA_09085 [Enterococcus sp. 22-H-5-01]|uniref:hypothetical protein n=1 Tax=Enterococcus sp. 22-H-5-01 TaxID=3418555 RepID=UPI003D06FB3A